jgi:hypothetical protein
MGRVFQRPFFSEALVKSTGQLQPRMYNYPTSALACEFPIDTL